MPLDTSLQYSPNDLVPTTENRGSPWRPLFRLSPFYISNTNTYCYRLHVYIPGNAPFQFIRFGWGKGGKCVMHRSASQHCVRDAYNRPIGQGCLVFQPSLEPPFLPLYCHSPLLGTPPLLRTLCAGSLDREAINIVNSLYDVHKYYCCRSRSPVDNDRRDKCILGYSVIYTAMPS